MQECGCGCGVMVRAYPGAKVYTLECAMKCTEEIRRRVNTYKQYRCPDCGSTDLTTLADGVICDVCGRKFWVEP
jgi:ribosomal protein L37AE/L43A